MWSAVHRPHDYVYLNYYCRFLIQVSSFELGPLQILLKLLRKFRKITATITLLKLPLRDR